VGRIDHIVIGVRDLQVAGEEIFSRYGLEAQAGGSHSGAGMHLASASESTTRPYP